MDEQAPYQYYEDVNLGVLRIWGSRREKSVLDVGCGFATTSERIERQGNRVTGIEENAVACDTARGRLSRVLRADLQDVERVAEQLGAELFDTIVFADVLEHLAWPVGVLRSYLRFLKPEGSVIVSLPNVGLWSVRFSHLSGRWEYEETGVLDRTHLRFFTRRSARWMLEQASLRPVAHTYNPGLVRPLVPLAKRLMTQSGTTALEHDPAALLTSKSYRFYLKLVYPVERVIASLWPGMLAFQMVYEAKLNR